MLAEIKNAIPKFIRKRASTLYLDSIKKHVVRSYAQEGEDRVLAKYFKGKTTGFYVDVGAHHPHRYSNTFLFYKMGWSGINVDAMPKSMESFRRHRPRDINIECGVGAESAVLEYYIFNEPALNGFDSELSKKREREFEQFFVIDTKQIEVRPLASILHQNITNGTEIDFLSVDVEGYDYDVLRSNDWEAFRPKVVLVELLMTSLATYHENPVTKLLFEQQYVLFAKTYNTFFFGDVAKDHHLGW